MSSDNMQYLNVDQALADAAYFIDYKKIEKNIRDSKVIVFGGSYAGNMAAWIRIKYPHLIQVSKFSLLYKKVIFYPTVRFVVRVEVNKHEPEARALCPPETSTAITRGQNGLSSLAHAIFFVTRPDFAFLCL